MATARRKHAPRAGKSESVAWDTVFKAAKKILRSPGGLSASTLEAARELESLSLEMLNQLSRGVHENPPLVVWGLNPPKSFAVKVVDKMGTAEQVRYQHDHDKQHYKHDFQRGDDVLAVQIGKQRAILIASAKGRDLWNVFK